MLILGIFLMSWDSGDELFDLVMVIDNGNRMMKMLEVDGEVWVQTIQDEPIYRVEEFLEGVFGLNVHPYKIWGF